MSKLSDDLITASEDLLKWILEKSELIPENIRILMKESLAPVAEKLEIALKAAKEQNADPTVIKLFCKNDKCVAKNTFITRTQKMAESSVWFCDACMVPMSS